jgi:hypothetical protein
MSNEMCKLSWTVRVGTHDLLSLRYIIISNTELMNTALYCNLDMRKRMYSIS